MVNHIAVQEKTIQNIRDVLTETQVHQLVKEYVKDGAWQLIGEEIKPASDGISGFLGDHFKICLHVKVDDGVKKIRLFAKSMPLVNQSKAKFIDEGDFYRREMTMLKLFHQMKCADDAKPWCPKAFIFTDHLVVMPDLCFEGYRLHPLGQTLDLSHAMLAATSLARYHATFANYETKKTITRDKNYTILDDHGDIIKEYNFKDCPWLRAAGKLSANIIKLYSKRFGQDIPDLEEKMVTSYIEACDRLRVYEETLNVVIHKDLWMNNIMFRYEGGVPTNALLLDFQCVRYAPPAFDVMIMLNLTTSRLFREEHEKEVLLHYFLTFSNSLEPSSRIRMQRLHYVFDDFMKWVEVGRMFGLMEAIAISPYVLMDPKSAQKIFDDPGTFEKYTNEDRTEPVVSYCQSNNFYKARQVELTEEYVERYIVMNA